MAQVGGNVSQRFEPDGGGQSNENPQNLQSRDPVSTIGVALLQASGAAMDVANGAPLERYGFGFNAEHPCACISTCRRD
jgi:hypothetical protein